MSFDSTFTGFLFHPMTFFFFFLEFSSMKFRVVLCLKMAHFKKRLPSL